MENNSIESCRKAGVDATVAEHFKPRLQQLLRSLRLDVAYESGLGATLFHRNEQGETVEVLDLVGGYGSLLLGHSHPVLVAEAVKVLTTRRPFHAQGSIRCFAQQLARALSSRLGGDYIAVFANSGTEAVEAAIKHALLETGGRTFIALEGAFHGKTLGALQLTANAQYRQPFDFPGPAVIRIPPNDLEALESAFAQTPHIAGFIFEPIQGEGGVRPLTSSYCQRAAALCAKHRVPLMADECQTGVGRTGAFLGCDHLGVRPNYIILSKSLGGGLAKISALLIERKRYHGDFDLKHTSTYADDDFSCAIALKTLELLDAAAIQKCAALGALIQGRLRSLAEQFLDVIADVRGIGLMIGVEFRKRTLSSSMTLRFLSAQDELLFMLMGYLWHAHRIRVAPTLSDRWTLRLEPPLLVSDEEIEHVLSAFADVCQRLRNDDAVGLTFFLGDSAPRLERPLVGSDRGFFVHNPSRFSDGPKHTDSHRVAWLCHFVDNHDLVSLEAAFGCLPDTSREWYLERSVGRSCPVVMGGIEIRSMTGAQVWFCPILLPFTSRWAKRQLDAGYDCAAGALVQRGVDLARDLQCEVVSLGQYTSILTRNGTRLDPYGLSITTGNSYALVLSIQALERAQRERGRRTADSTLAVIGAAGNIGRAAAELLGPLYRETLLVGRSLPGSVRRLQELSVRIPRSRVQTDLAAVGSADTVLVATNAVEAPLQASHFKDRVIVCDVSVPSAIAREVKALRPDILLITGGIAALPYNEDLELPGFPLPRGQTYGCMAEAMLLGFESVPEQRFTGAISAHHLRRVGDLAVRHGFELAEYSSHSVLVADCEEELCYVAQ